MKRRRIRGEGNIRRRTDGRFEARLSLGTDADNNRLRRSVYGKTVAEVIDGLNLLRADLRPLRNGKLAKPRQEAVDERTVAQYLDWWLEKKVRVRNRQSTYELRKLTIRNHLNPYFSSTALTALEPENIEAVLDYLERAGVGGRTRQVVYSTLCTALNDAVRRGYVSKNVCMLVERPRAQKKKIIPLTLEQIRKLLDAASREAEYCLLLTALTTALREGELFALFWNDVDLDDATIFVRNTLTKDEHGKLVRTDPKTPSSGRAVALPTITVKALRRLRSEQERAAYTGLWVFASKRGGPIRKENFLHRQFYRLLERAELPRSTFHALRHAANSLLSAKLVAPKILADRMGHTSMRMLDTYTHSSLSMQREAAEKVDEIFADRR